MPDDPTPVEVKNENPLPVEIRSTEDTSAQVDARVIAAAANVDASVLRTEDQRRISHIWERTQQVIALAVVLDTLVVVSLLVVAPVGMVSAGVPVDEAIKTAAVGGLLFLTAVSNLVIGFYFGRTNHTRVGGAASRDDDIRGR